MRGLFGPFDSAGGSSPRCCDGGAATRTWPAGGQPRAGVALGQVLIVVGLVLFGTAARGDGLWLALIGWFVLSSAKSEETSAEMTAAFGDLRVGDVMTHDVEVADGSRTVLDFVDHDVRTTLPHEHKIGALTTERRALKGNPARGRVAGAQTVSRPCRAGARGGIDDAMGSALIVVDVQNDFCPGGSLAVPRGDEVAARITEWIAQQDGRYQLVVATMDWHPSLADRPEFAHFSTRPDFVDTWPVHCVQGTDGARLHSDLRLPDDAVIVRKGHDDAAYSGFEGRTDSGVRLETVLKNADVDEIDVVGLATDYCVRATALDARTLGLEVRVLGDLTAGVDEASTEHALADMAAAGIELTD